MLAHQILSFCNVSCLECGKLSLLAIVEDASTAAKGVLCSIECIVSKTAVATKFIFNLSRQLFKRRDRNKAKRSFQRPKYKITHSQFIVCRFILRA